MGNEHCFRKVFDLILKVAVEGSLMIKKVFVFSDMEFDQASMNPWETDYETIVRKFKMYDYENCVPEICFLELETLKSLHQW